jgi:polysaccharide biosynthesis transport protein
MNDNTTDAASIFAPIWKRKWLILAVGLLVAIGTYEYYKHQTPVYSASTELYFGAPSEQQGSSGGAGKIVTGRALTNQVGVINSPLIGESVRRRLRREHLDAAARGKAKATVNGSSAFVTIKTQAHTPKAAVQLADAYAQTFIKRQRADYIRSITAQLENTTQQLHRIELPPPTAKGKRSRTASSSSTLQAANLASKINQLESDLATFTGVEQVGKAQANPLPLSPAPKKNAIFGFVLGLLLAAIASYVLVRFDRRLRSLQQVESLFQTQILAALPAVKSPVIRPDGRRAPAKSLVEPLRRLHTALELGDILTRRSNGGARTILFLSAESGDGRSSLIANLAGVQSEAGERVAVIEADFRRPTLARLLGVDGPYGLADVLGGKVAVEEAMQTVSAPAHLDLGAGAAKPVGGVSTVVESRSMGSVSVLVGGGAVANPPALLAGREMSDLLRTLTDEFAFVLIDVPPPLEVSDAMPLLAAVDGIVVVARIGHTRDIAATRLVQLLGRSASSPVLGAVVNCVPRKDIERYGFAWASTGAARRGKLIGR